jgi:hypothetical protein
MKVSRFAVTQLQLMRYILFFKFLTVFHTFHVQRLELSSVWALLAAFENPLQIPQSDSHGVFEGAFVRDVDSFSWMGNNTRKLFPMQSGTPECWTFFSTAAYGRRNKVPQVVCFLKVFNIFLYQLVAQPNIMII